MAVKEGFLVSVDGAWQEIFVKGVNISTSLPGKWFTEFPREEGIYLDWLKNIGQMHANSVRVYILLPPGFYRALLYYNIKHPAEPLWLFQEIWPEENPPGEVKTVVSWPTLDVTEHGSEWNEYGLKSLEYNDKASVDINRIAAKEKLKAGFFGAYHIYPNYPEFMNNESGYADYFDEEGQFRYGGYLKEFIATHTRYPALVAEIRPIHRHGMCSR